MPSSDSPQLEIGVDELEGLLDGGVAQLLDVREAWEFRRGYVPSAENIPLSQLGLRFRSLQHDRQIAVICEHGNRSLMVADFLRQQGWQDAVSVRGGTDAWVRSGRQIVRPADGR